jgi:hypothetical protein
MAEAEALPPGISLPGESSAGASRLAVNLPLDLPKESILAAIQTHATLPLPNGELTEVSLASPDDSVILAVYSALSALASKYDAEVQARETREVDIESQLNASDHVRNEAEAKASQAMREAEAAEAERRSAREALDEKETELALLKASVQNGTAASAEIKAVLDKEQGEKKELLEVLGKERAEGRRRSGE